MLVVRKSPFRGGKGFLFLHWSEDRGQTTEDRG
nr:MAG TPA: hypothetical protein [Caudoviricetes sp.]